jgi:hypothetical protein
LEIKFRRSVYLFIVMSKRLSEEVSVTFDLDQILNHPPGCCPSKLLKSTSVLQLVGSSD